MTLPAFFRLIGGAILSRAPTHGLDAPRNVCHPHGSPIVQAPIQPPKDIFSRPDAYGPFSRIPPIAWPPLIPAVLP